MKENCEGKTFTKNSNFIIPKLIHPIFLYIDILVMCEVFRNKRNRFLSRKTMDYWIISNFG